MERPKITTTGNRKLIATILSLACIMVVGYTASVAALIPVIGGIVSVLGLFLTGNIIRKFNQRNTYRNEHSESDFGKVY